MASWVDTFKLPLREIEEKYTTSELVLLSLDSRLKSYNLNKRYKTGTKTSKDSDNKVVSIENRNSSGVRETDTCYELPKGINNGTPIPKKFFNAEGEMDLRLGSGPEVATYLRRIGINLVVPFAV